MSMESTLQALLLTVCPRVWADVAKVTTPPYVVWQGIGGESIRYGDNTAPDKRDTLMQIAAWSQSRAESLALIRQIEELLCAAAFQCKPEGEPANTYDPDTKLHGSIQRFSIFADR